MSDPQNRGHEDGDIYTHEEATNVVAPSGHEDEVLEESTAHAYWRANIYLLLKLLAVWFMASFGAGILFGPALDHIQFFGFKLGFWFGQQGSIYVFVAIIFVYVWRMNVLENRFGLNDSSEKGGSPVEGEAS